MLKQQDLKLGELKSIFFRDFIYKLGKTANSEGINFSFNLE